MDGKRWGCWSASTLRFNATSRHAYFFFFLGTTYSFIVEDLWLNQSHACPLSSGPWSAAIDVRTCSSRFSAAGSYQYIAQCFRPRRTSCGSILGLYSILGDNNITVIAVGSPLFPLLHGHLWDIREVVLVFDVVLSSVDRHRRMPLLSPAVPFAPNEFQQENRCISNPVSR